MKKENCIEQKSKKRNNKIGSLKVMLTTQSSNRFNQ